MNRYNTSCCKAAAAVLFGCISLIASAQTPPASLSELTAAATSHDTIELNWSGASTGTVDIYRDDSLLTVPQSNDGSYTDNIIRKEGDSYLYKVCETDSDTCSNIAGVIF